MDKIIVAIFLILLGAIVAGVIASRESPTFSEVDTTSTEKSGSIWEDTVDITIADKERVNYSNESKYLIYTEEGETFENRDSLIRGKFDSSDLYGRLKRGSRYRCRVTGIRNKFFSWYRNIVSCEEL